MVLHHARRRARTGPGGELIPLEEQDRSLWDWGGIREGAALLDRALLLGRPGPFQIQAAIAALHAEATTAADTDWVQIAALYSRLLAFLPTPVVALNRAAAFAMARGPELGLVLLDQVAEDPAIAEYHLLHAARADLLRRAGRFDEAARWYRSALDRVTNRVDSISAPAEVGTAETLALWLSFSEMQPAGGCSAHICCVHYNMSEIRFGWDPAEADQTGIPYQALNNLSVRACVESKRELNLEWRPDTEPVE